MRIVEEIKGYKPGDIVKLKFGCFKSLVGRQIVSSNHLFVVVDSENVCEISSQNNKVSGKFKWNVEIKDWKSAGLLKPSHVKTDCYGEVDDHSIFKYYGKLSEEDRSNVLSRYSASPQNTILEWYEQ